MTRAPASLLHRLVVLLGAVAFAVILAVLAVRWSRDLENHLGEWAVAELARRTDGTYRLMVSDLSVLPLTGSISFDSATVGTDTARNRRREKPLPTLEWRAYGCRVVGLDLLRMALLRSFVARELGCSRAVARVALPSRPPERRRPGSDSTSAPAAALEELARPFGLSSFRIGDVSLPALSFTLKRAGRRGGTTFLLERARFEAKDLVFDLTGDPQDRQNLSADQARLWATGLVLRRDPLTEIAIAGVEAGLTDSTLRLAGARHEPSIPEDEWVRRVRVRRDRIRFELDSLRARGVAYRAFLADEDIGIRALELEGARLDVLTDKRIRRGRPTRYRIPQQLAASPGLALLLDSVVVTRGTIVYREREPDRDRPGHVSFGSVRATILGLHLPPRGRPLRIRASAQLMSAGLLTVDATVPLDAPDFRYELSGRLQGMPVKAFNRFLAENESFEFDDGWIEGITFRQTSRGGRATTTLTPRYRDLSVEPTDDGGGVIGSVSRAANELIADAFVVRSRNPDEDGENLRTARTVHRYDPAQNWIRFLWFGLRDALKEAVKE
jgi:hypothetical protein